MDAQTSMKLPVWFWIAAGLAAAWALVGVASYIADVTTGEEALAAMPAEQRTLYEARPSWLTGVYAISVFAALAGAVALLLRRKIATPILALSLAAIVVQFGYVFLAMNALNIVGATGAILPSAVFIIAAAVLWFSTNSAQKGWLR